MNIAFDRYKDVLNQQKHRISLARAAEMDFEAAVITIDDREDYGEVRFKAIGFIAARLHTLIYTEDEMSVRAISLRQATRAEMKEFVNA